MTAFTSDIPAVDRYLEGGYDAVRGMSSRFSATLIGWLMGHQNALGIAGNVAEIGTFEGRLFIALCLAMRDGEKALGIDTFDWPGPETYDRFEAHMARWGVDRSVVEVHKGGSQELTSARIVERLGGPVRLFHVDGEHSRAALHRDLDLAYGTMSPEGLIVLDDMLHPEFPLLVVAAHEWLERHPDMKVLAILDREDIVGAAKFVLCKADAVELYEKPLMARFPEQHYVMGSEWERYWCVVMTPRPRLVDFSA
jgi:predicted O-methyltransferase YrrM